MHSIIGFFPSIPSVTKHLGLDDQSEIAGRLRAHQIRTMMSTTPLMMMVITAIALIMFGFLHGRPGTGFLGYWTVALCVISTIGYFNSSASNKRPEVYSASPKAPQKAVRGVFLLGAMWGLVPALLYPHADFQSKMTIIAIIGGILGGGAMSLYVVPRALFTFLGAVCIGTVIGLFKSGDNLDLGLIALLSCYTIALMRAGWTLAITYAESVLSTIRLNEKSETISLLLRDFSENASDWLWETDIEGNVLTGKKEFASHLGFQPSSPDVACANITSHIATIKGLKEFWALCEKRKSFRDLVISTSGDDSQHWVSLSGKPLIDNNGEFIGYRGVASDITESKLAEERIAYLAHNDALTGLVNRPHFAQAIEKQLKSRRNENVWSIMFLDLDGFKLINDTKGHAVGDSLLIEVAARLKRSLGSHDVIARLGGDEFAILCTSATSLESTAGVAEKLLEKIAAPYDLGNGISIPGIGLSIGIAVGRKDGTSESELLRNADLALYRSKSEGKGTFRFFEVEMDEVVKDRRSLEQDLREALQLNQLSLSYQPLVSASDQHTEGFEALVRWHHPVRGLISPADFIPLAESLGVISEIGDWVVRQACKEAVTWPSNLSVAVNLSPQQFQKKRILQSVRDAISETGIDPKRLELEITEGLFIENTAEVISVLNELKQLGVSIALDDFGTGYSSLSYLLKFPFDKLKIDRSFISAIQDDMVARNVLEAIAKLGNVLDLKVTAEGVETLAQMEALSGLSCTHFQGYLFGKPLATVDLPAYLLLEASAADNGGLSVATEKVMKKAV